MKVLSISLILFGLIIIIFPEFLAYLIGGFFVVVGINMITMSIIFNTKMKSNEDYIKFGKYKIYR